MEIDKQALRNVWWRGAISNALKGIPIGMASGLAAGALLSFAILPMVPALAPMFATFLTMPGISTGFLPVPLMIFNTAITVAVNFFTGGTMACNAYKQDIDHRMNKARIDALEVQVTHAKTMPTIPSRAMQTILARGPRGQHGYATAEEMRAASTAHTVLH